MSIDIMSAIREKIVTDSEMLISVVNLHWDPVWTQEYPRVFLDDSDYEELKNWKMKIDDSRYHSKWEEIKKIFNRFENIHTSSNKERLDENIANYVPLSRSYFKLWELIYDYDLIPNNVKKGWKSCHVAEGPGGFLEAAYTYRQKKGLLRQDNVFHTITLISKKKEIPTFHKAKQMFRHNSNVMFHYGADRTGDIYELRNIEHFVERVTRGSCDFFTADGGIDYSNDFNCQEYLSVRLFIAQIIIGLQVLKPGGNFVCKIFDTYLKITLDLIWILSKCFEKLYIVKPVTSRPANSEKYIIGIGCLGCPMTVVNKLAEVLEYYKHLASDLYLKTILPDFSFDPIFQMSIENYNKIHTSQQLTITKLIFHMIEEGDSSIQMETIISENIQECIRWCLKYNMTINPQCKFLKYINVS